MPNPKRRHSKTSTAKRRTHDALKPVGRSECPQCHEAKQPHRVCPHCGHYRGRQVAPSTRVRFHVQSLTGLAASAGRGNRHTDVRIAIDAIGGDAGPPSSSTARWSPLDISRSDCCSLATAPRSRPSCRVTRWPACPRHRSPDRSRAGSRRDGREPPMAALRRKPRASIRVAAEAVRDGRADALFSAGHTGASVMAVTLRSVFSRPRPSGPGDHHPDAASPRRAARFRSERRLPRVAPGAVRGHGFGVCACCVGPRASNRRPVVGRRGGEQGKRADARGASAAQGVAGHTSSATWKGATSSPATLT